MRRLVVVRHAKSAWPWGVPDRQRPLGPRGHRDAPRMARRLTELVGRVDIAIISPARRSLETWDLMSPHLEHGEVRRESRVYEAWGSQMIDVVQGLPDEALTVLIMGHEPGVSELVLTLANSRNRELRGRVGTKFPTCAFAVVRADRPWAAFVPGCADLEAFTTPRD